MTHKVFKGETLAIEAFETRVLGLLVTLDDPARLKSAPMPEEIMAQVHAGLTRRGRPAVTL